MGKYLTFQYDNILMIRQIEDNVFLKVLTEEAQTDFFVKIEFLWIHFLRRFTLSI